MLISCARFPLVVERRHGCVGGVEAFKILYFYQSSRRRSPWRPRTSMKLISSSRLAADYHQVRCRHLILARSEANDNLTRFAGSEKKHNDRVRVTWPINISAFTLQPAKTFPQRKLPSNKLSELKSKVSAGHVGSFAVNVLVECPHSNDHLDDY